MIDQCDVISKSAQQAEYEANAVSVYLGDTFNALSNLSNKKFIENSMAPFEESSSKPTETKDKPVVSAEKKMENYQKALNYAINVFNITSNEDDDILMKSHTMSMAMFKSADHLPFIVGSKAYGQDEYLGIIDRHEKDSKYLRGVGEEAPTAEQPGNENANMSPASGAQNAMSVTNFRPTIDGASNLTEIRNTTLGPPPPLESLLSGSFSGSSEARNESAAGPRPGMGLMGEISARGNLMNEINARGNMMNEINARGNMLNEINARGNLMNEIAARGQGEAPAGGRANLMAEINARGNMMNEINARGNLMDEIAGRGRMQTEAPAAGGRANLMNEINARGNLMNEIANRGRLQTDAGRGSANPMFQALAQPQAKSNKLFDDDEEDVEIGNADMFKSTSTNKKKFENLLGNPMPMGTSSMGMGNPLGLPGLGASNPLGMNPFDPYASMNPFMPFQPKSEQAQAAAQKPEPKLGGNPMMSLASEIKAAAASRGGEDNEEKDMRASKANKLNKLFEDSDEDEEARLNKQKELSQKYRGETKVTSIEERAAPISSQKPNARVSKLFDDEEEDLGFAARKNTAPIKKDFGLGKSTAAKKKMFDDDDEIKEEDESPIKKAPVAKKLDEDDDLADSQARRSKTMAGGKPAKATLFDDDDDDAPIGGRQSKAPAKIEPKKKDKKTLFDDDDEDDVGFSTKKDTKPPVIAAKKKMFDDDDEPEPVVIEKPKPQPVFQEEPKPIIREEPKPIVREEPKVEVVVPEVKKEEVIRQPEPKVEVVPEVMKEVVASTEDENRGARASTSTNLTQLIKASQLNRKKKHFGGSSEEDSDSDGSDAAPVRKPPVKTQPPVIQEVQEVIPEVKKEEEVIRQPEPEPVLVAVTRVEEPVPVVEVKAEEEPKPVVEEKPKNISSKISALQNQLNLNMDMFKPGGDGPRKPKASIQPAESTERKEENLAPGQLSHSAAMAKPKQQARAKKTIMFDDDDEEDKKPSDPFVSKTYVAPKVEPVQPVPQYTPPVQQQPVYEEPPAFRPSTTSAATKKVAWKDDDEEEQTNTRPSYSNTTQAQPPRASTTSGSDNPMALLSGLKALDSKSGRASTKKALYDDDEEEEQPKPAARPSNLGMTSGGDNPLALLSSLQAMDAEKGRKSNKGKKGKGIFDDDEDDVGFAPKKEEPRKSAATQGRQSSKMNTLFDDSDEDKNQSWGKKSEAPSKTQSKAANNRKTLFDDDD